MRFLTMSLVAVSGANLVTEVATTVKQEQGILETINHEIIFNNEIDMFHKDTTSNDFKSNGQFVNLGSNQSSKFILNEEQTTLLNDTTATNLNIRINYRADFITSKVKKSADVHQDFNDLLRETTEQHEYKIKNLKGEDISFFIESKDMKIVHQEAKGKASLQLLPYLKFKLDDFEDNKRDGFYSLKITSIVITGNSEVYNLSKVKRRNYVYKFDKGTEIKPKEFIRSEDFMNWYKSSYEDYLPYDWIDLDKTLSKLKIDQFNSSVDSDLNFKIYLKEQFKTVGDFTQTISFRINKIEVPDWEPETDELPSYKPESKKDLSNYEDENTTRFKTIEAKRVSPLKYLWLLTIPVFSGIVTLITYFLPFKKRKRKNEIK